MGLTSTLETNGSPKSSVSVGFVVWAIENQTLWCRVRSVRGAFSWASGDVGSLSLSSRRRSLCLHSVWEETNGWKRNLRPRNPRLRPIWKGPNFLHAELMAQIWDLIGSTLRCLGQRLARSISSKAPCDTRNMLPKEAALCLPLHHAKVKTRRQ